MMTQEERMKAKVICLDCEMKGNTLTVCDYHMKNGFMVLAPNE